MEGRRRRIGYSPEEIQLVRASQRAHPNSNELRRTYIINNIAFLNFHEDLRALYADRLRAYRRISDIIRRELNK